MFKFDSILRQVREDTGLDNRRLIIVKIGHVYLYLESTIQVWILHVCDFFWQFTGFLECEDVPCILVDLEILKAKAAALIVLNWSFLKALSVN